MIQSCYCPDGTQSGVQGCTNGVLGECGCIASNPTIESPVADGGPIRLCPELAGVDTCSAKSYASSKLPANILFLLDRSGSMACNPPPTQTVADCNTSPIPKNPEAPTRWSITVDALNATFASIADSTASVGLSTFSVDGACGVDSTPNVGLSPISAPQIDSLARTLDAFWPRGGTPIVGATTLAFAYLHQEAQAPGNRYVVLITDGAESCGFKGDESNVQDLAAARTYLLDTVLPKARDANIRTFVVGAPGSEGARGFLSELAYRGGTARSADCVHGDPEGTTGDCHYDLTSGTDFAKVLGDALGQISGHALGCEFETPPGTTSLVNVQYTVAGVPLCAKKDDRPCDQGADGWQFAKMPDGADDPRKVVLCGPACDQVKSRAASVDVIVGCPPIR